MKKHFARAGVGILLMLILASCATTSGPGAQREARAFYKMGVGYLNSNRLQAAYVEFQKSLKKYPNDKEVHNALGIVHLKLIDPERAIQSFTTAVRLDRKYSEAYNNLCYVHYEQKQWEEAIKNCQSALKNKLYETPEKAFYNLGRTYYRSGRFREAAEAFDNGIRRFPVHANSYYSLALAYNALKNYGKAAETMERAINLDRRFSGDIEKAEAGFMKMRNTTDYPQDIDDYIEILKY